VTKVDVVFEERYWYPDDGAIVWLAGYQLIDEDGRFLARDDPRRAAEIAGDLDAATAWSAVALREARPSPRDPRSGLTMLLARAPAIGLDRRPRGR